MKSVVILRSNSVRPDPRVEKEAFCLKEAGYNVSVVAWDRDSSHRNTNEKIIGNEEYVPITRVGELASYGDGMKNIIPFFRFQVRMACYLFSNRKKYDVIHACDFDTAFTAMFMSMILKKKFVFDIFDFICGRPANAFQKIIKYLQIKTINYADATIICTEKRKAQIKGASPKKLAIIHNSPQVVSMYKKIPNSNGKTKIVYVGILQEHRLLKEILQYIIKCIDLEIHIAGFGKHEDIVREYSDKYENVFYYGKISYQETLELEQEADIMLAIYDPTIENHVFAAPNKFYEGLMLGKPLIMVNGTGMSEFVEQYDLGVVIEYSEEGFRNGVEELIAKKSEWKLMSGREREIYSKMFSWDTMKMRLLELYSEI